MTRKTLAAAALLALALAARGRAAHEPPPLAITGARIVVAPGKTLERATIVFRKGVIEAVGESVTPPPDAVVADGKGLTIYAGFIDASASFPLELGSPEAARAREGAPPETPDEAPVETPEARRKGLHPSLEVASAVILENDRRALERKAGFTVALATPPRAFLAGQSAVLALGDRSRRSSVIAPHAFLHASLHGPEPFDWHSYPHSLMGAHAHIRQAFADARWQRKLAAHGARAAFDPELAALWPALDRKLRVAWQVDTKDDAERAVALARELGLELAVTDAREAAKAAPLLRREGVPAIVSLAWGPRPKPATREVDPTPRARKGRGGKPLEGPFSLWKYLVRPASIGGEPPAIGPKAPGPPTDPTQETRAAFEERSRKHDEQVNALKDLFLAGIRTATGSAGLKEPAEVRERLREAIKAGLPEEAALAALTRDAAIVLGLGDKLGTLEPGKLAFATILTSSLADEKARVRWLVIDGERFDVERIEEDLRLARLAGRYAFELAGTKGVLVLEALPGKLGGRVEVPGKAPATFAVKLEGDRLTFTLPGPTPKETAAVSARWVEADLLEGTASFPDGAHVFRAKREPR